MIDSLLPKNPSHNAVWKKGVLNAGTEKSVIPMHFCSILIIGLSLIGREVLPA